MIQFFRKRPWILVVFAFLILVSAWISLFFISKKFEPPPLEVLQETEAN